MEKEYNNLEEIVADYPNLYGMYVAYDYKGVMYACLCFEEAHFEADIWSIAYNAEWKNIKIVQDIFWFVEVTIYKNLQGLILRFEKNFAFPDAFAFDQLPHLRKLHLSYEGIYSAEKRSIALPALPQLETLTLYGWEEVRLTDRLEHIKRFGILRTGKVVLPTLLSQLNPDTLTSLTIQHIRNLVFFPDLQKPKRGESLPTFTDLEAFTHLKHLGVASNKFKKMPFALAPFHALESLDLATNKFEVFPDDFLELKHLQKIDISATPLVKNKIIKGGNELVKLITSFEENKVSGEERRVLFGILTEKENLEQSLTLQDLLRFSVLTTNSNLLRKIIALCEKKVTENPLDALSDIKHITLLGKMPAITFPQLKSFFEAHGIVVQNKITAKTQAVCVGEKPNAQEIEGLLQTYQHLPICFPTHLKGYMQQLETPYLATSDEEVTHNLELLLLSEDESNVVLALQMMKTGGLPELLFEYLCFKVIENNWKYRKETLNLLEKYATSAQFMVIKKISGNYNDYKKNLQWLIDSPEFDNTSLVACALKFFTHQKTNYFQRRFLYMLKGILWQTEGKAFELLLNHYLQENGTLILENESMDLNKIPASLAGNPNIKKIILVETFLGKQSQKAGKTILNSLPNLREIEVLSKLHKYAYDSEEEVEQVKQEETAIYTTMLSNFPVTVTFYDGRLSGD